MRDDIAGWRRIDGMIATPVYASLLAIVLFVLALRVVALRRRFRIGVGDGGQVPLQRAIRAHANFAEYVPLVVLLLYFVETRTQAGAWVHVFGIALLAGRIVHAGAVSQIDESIRARVVGMTLTFAALLGSALWLLWHAARAAML
jgi:uncharacterized membrane protein YecN with MAPEG domain